VERGFADHSLGMARMGWDNFKGRLGINSLTGRQDFKTEVRPGEVLSFSEGGLLP